MLVDKSLRLINSEAYRISIELGDSKNLSTKHSLEIKNLFNNLTDFYKESSLFRLRFENTFKNGNTFNTRDLEDDIAAINHLVRYLSSFMSFRPWQFTQLFCYHVQTDLRGASLLEIGGFQKESTINLFGVSDYCGTGLDDVNVEREKATTSKSHRFETLDIQKTTDLTNIKSPSRIFSTACFEHIREVELALNNCFNISQDESYMYIYIAPIFSAPNGGEHGYIDVERLTDGNAYGFHLLPKHVQVQKLKSLNIDADNIKDILTTLYFNDDINEHCYEFYRRTLTESPFVCIKFDEIRNLNLHKAFKDKHIEIRKYIGDKDMTVLGIRAILSKGLLPIWSDI